MIARPLLDRLEAVRGNVDLVVLRPPTLDLLAGALSRARAAGEPFVLLDDAGPGGRARLFRSPAGVIEARRPEEVRPALDETTKAWLDQATAELKA